MLSNEIPIVTVSYNSPDLISDLLESIRKFYKNIIYIIDGSDSENANKTKTIYKNLDKWEAIFRGLSKLDNKWFSVY